MAVTLTSQRLPGGNAVKVTAVSDLGGTPTFYWYRNGVFVGSSPVPFRVFHIDPEEPVQIQCFDSASDVASPDFNGRMVLTWIKPVGDTPHEYRVYQRVTGDPDFVLVHTFDAGTANYFQFESEVLNDGVSYDFQVVGVNVNGVEGLEYEFSYGITRRPDITRSTYAFDSGTGNLTVAEA